MKGEKIFITGGAGFLGKNIVRRLVKDNEITVYSRDEAKHYYMKKEFPQVKFVVGDVRNRDYLVRKSRHHSIGIFAASLKQIEACDENYEEAKDIIIDGAFNSRLVAEENGFKSACFISSDKSRAATTIYGAMKYVAGEGFISGDSSCNLTTAVYGNVMNSTGSIIPLIWNYIQRQQILTLYDPNMTRFLLDVEDAVNLILKSTKYKNCNIIPVINSFSIKHLFEIYQEEFGLKYEIGAPRTGEKIHEIMASKEEIRRIEYVAEDDIYLLHPKKEMSKRVKFVGDEYSSKDNFLSKEGLYQFLKNKKFYK
jgi:UDP-N-acetylglucosamine 4,6-dehydratase/5-epimerase